MRRAYRVKRRKSGMSIVGKDAGEEEEEDEEAEERENG